MIKRSSLQICVILFYALAVAAVSAFAEKTAQVEGPLTLAECYSLALKQSEIIAIDAEKIREAEGHFLEALGTLLPHFSFSSQDLWGDPSSSTNDGSVRKFVAKQTLFQGFKELATVRGGRSEMDQRKNEKIWAEQLLFLDVAGAFYLFLEKREELEALRTAEQALKDRLKELVDRERLGRSRRSEVVNTEALLYGAVADIELVKAQKTLARQLLEFLVGRPVEDVVDTEALPAVMRPESEYLPKAKTRADVLAAQKSWDLFKNNVIVARSGFFPTVSLENNYYAQRSIAPEDAKWDATLKIDVPIFQGTETFGIVKSAVAQEKQAGLRTKRAGRSAFQDVKDSYVRCESALLICQAVRKVLSAAEMNYVLQKQEYKLNLVDNVTVLDALRGWYISKRDYIRSLFEAKRSFWQLRVLSGEIVTGR